MGNQFKNHAKYSFSCNFSRLFYADDETLMGADTGENAINILLLGQSDCRHIFRTLEEHLNLRMREIKINVRQLQFRC